ncbi:putative Pectinesterase-1 precursor [Tripterygium wilfordii]|uniref:Pectinesterase n=1 Tax=Tripterygium wilfordii TaxID=458696 RepID=A0A7J7CUK6_TRIWF|nr:pectinesterase-like [Tripterygium wilfordii]KAF5737753.1 putative Pectinesterase-1 precursor [Tripterygium wilfordii]
MEILAQPLLIIAHLLTFSFTLVHGIGTIKSCNQTPYPKTCNHFMIQTNPMSTPEQNLFTFRDQSLRVTMNKAIEAHHLVSSMDLTLFDQRAKLAWLDCLELFEDSVDLINRSVSTNSPFDSQTWLSAAIANHQTCQNGFIEHYFNSSAYHLNSLPFMLSDFQELLSNSLAINKANVVAPETNGRRRLLVNGFPTWVSAADRKLLQSRPGLEGPKYDVVVAQDGSGNYKTISEAVEAVAKSRKGSTRYVIHVKAGVYRENVEIKKAAKNLMIIGDGIDATIVTGSKNAQDGSTTFRSATFAISAEGFIARDIAFENTAGPQKHQAVALRSRSDFSAFYRCSFKGYQDTLYVYSQRQFYRDCDIYGTIDFIFGDAAAMFQNCNIYVRKPMDNQRNTVTAQGRSDQNENTGIVIHNSRIMAAPDLRAVQGSFKTYLGRPWKKYSRTVFVRSFLDGLIDPQGWLPWSGDFGLSTLYYGEYMNTGSGANTEGRVKWHGFHLITSATEAGKFTVGNFLAGESWIPATRVPFDSGL